MKWWVSYVLYSRFRYFSKRNFKPCNLPKILHPDQHTRKTLLQIFSSTTAFKEKIHQFRRSSKLAPEEKHFHKFSRSRDFSFSPEDRVGNENIRPPFHDAIEIFCGQTFLWYLEAKTGPLWQRRLKTFGQKEAGRERQRERERKNGDECNFNHVGKPGHPNGRETAIHFEPFRCSLS